MKVYDLAIIGAGPAGMNAAVRAASGGLSVVLIDEQKNPGGQIWRAVERQASQRTGMLLGPEYLEGGKTVADFRTSGCVFLGDTQLWQIEATDPGFRLFIRSQNRLDVLCAHHVLLAIGAQERATPFPGWTLPGVMTVGGAQIQLKSANQIPDAPVWIAGSGPLTLLYMIQLLAAGGQIAGYLDTTPPGHLLANLRALLHLIAGAGISGKLLKGLKWYGKLLAAGIPIIRHARIVRADGEDSLQSFTYESPRAGRKTVPARLLLVHNGVVPTIHIPIALNCAVEWDADRQYFRPKTDMSGETSVPGIFVAGDCAGIVGASGAAAQGELVGGHIAQRVRGGFPAVRDRSLAQRLKSETLLQDFLFGMYAVDGRFDLLPDDTIICRCEEITAGEIRTLVKDTRVGPNQLKAHTRCGMGPCQGRQCALNVTRMIAQIQSRPDSDVGLFRIRPPLKPITIGELAALHLQSGVDQ